LYKRNRAQSGDALALLQSLPDCCTPLIFFDPQHRAVLDKLQYGNEGARQKGRAKLPAMTEPYITECCLECARVLRPSGYLMLWLDTFHIGEAINGHSPGLDKVLKCVDIIAWDKLRQGMGPRSRRRGDYLLIFQKPPIAAKRTWHDHGIPDRWPEKVNRREHPHVKPIGLITRLIGAVTNPRDFVVDPAAGSFVVMRAANQLGRDFIGCDKAYSAAGVSVRAVGFAVTGCDRVSVGAHTQLMESGHGHLCTAKHGTAVDDRDAAMAASLLLPAQLPGGHLA
jgi:site-specific DNA-methyltransferase (adenine-specific)